MALPFRTLIAFFLSFFGHFCFLTSFWRRHDVTMTSTDHRHLVCFNCQCPGYDVRLIVPLFSVQVTNHGLDTVEKLPFWSRIDVFWRHCDVTNRHRPTSGGYSEPSMYQLGCHTKSAFLKWSAGSHNNKNDEKVLFFQNSDILRRHCDVTNRHGPMRVAEFQPTMSKLYCYTNSTLHQWSGGLPHLHMY